MKTIVVGSGVIGLTTAIWLRQNGIEANIIAKSVSPKTTSDVAAAFWCPYMAFPKEKCLTWAKSTREYFAKIAHDPSAGIEKRVAVTYLGDHEEIPWWTEVAEGVADADPKLLSAGFERAFVFDTFVVNMVHYMPYLRKRFESRGGKIITATLDTFRDICEEYSTVINCTGLGAKTLLNDTDLDAARGQVVRVRKPAGFDRVWIDDRAGDKFTMLVPRQRDLVLGGTYEKGVYSTEVDPEETKQIVERCSKLFGGVTDLEVLGAACGLRPVRSEIRLELEELPGGKILIHNYGHGGGGVTLSVGCAESVVSLVTAHSLRS
jgi:D-amino-acid oxidase